ncbi:hypothetical protein PoB_006635500 [Plakobranchus ocellatus]|uniref:Uncharacterized protein n=1 Tax=Plakobranchus ocellatus TaxID=259542 RepID=A0AAV4D6U0_9GAST|nr:hypothetical protein PoB_006635500 [Plakobranchus ocellatus]
MINKFDYDSALKNRKGKYVAWVFSISALGLLDPVLETDYPASDMSSIGGHWLEVIKKTCSSSQKQTSLTARRVVLSESAVNVSTMFMQATTIENAPEQAISTGRERKPRGDTAQRHLLDCRSHSLREV